MLNKLTELQKALVAAALILLLGFGGGYYAKGKLDNRVVHDTTFVPQVIPTPPPVVMPSIPAVLKPTKPVEKLVYVEDSTRVLKLNIQIQQLLSDQDSLRHRLTILLAEHYGSFNFEQSLGSLGKIGGVVAMKYTPMEETFGAAMQFTTLELNQEKITNTVRQVWWQRPLLFVSGAATAYFIQQHNTTGAAISGGVGLVNIMWEF